LDQQQLQIARAALWHQTADARLRTFDDATHWLDDIGLCLFLPRHTQLPAPAPSLVEACLGAPALTPPAPTIALATELAARLVDDRRAIPLNLLGHLSEQPDFLITPEVLPWTAAVRGDRQWKSAPAGRTAPIVIRAFEALDREGELTTVGLRERVGHEISEAAALRALVELWTTLRAVPLYAPGQPTRWTLLKNRFPAQLATAANTAQTTALSALLSLYFRSAVAATAEEAEIFLSPLTARSRIREVLHGLMATRQLGATTVAAQTLLFVEGSLPETLPASEPTPQAAPSPISSPAPQRKAPRPLRWERSAQPTPPPPDDNRRVWKKPPAAAHSRPAPDRREQPGKREGKRWFGSRPNSTPHPNRARPKSWQKPRRNNAGAQDLPQKNRPPRFEDRPPRSNRSSRPDRLSGEPRFRRNPPGSSEPSAPPGRNRPRFQGDRKSSAPRPQSGFSKARRDNNRSAGSSRPPRPEKFPARKSTPPVKRFTGQARPKNKFRNPAPRPPFPRKNRTQEENPE
jgi:23S rRNA pseudouridine2605 synthase